MLLEGFVQLSVDRAQRFHEVRNAVWRQTSMIGISDEVILVNSSESESMNIDPVCPVCQSHEWEVLGRKTWTVESMAGMDPIFRRRMRVVFEVWLPGSTDFTAQSLGCRQCGFVIYSPRPTAADIDNKYRFLTSIKSPEVKPRLDSEENIRRCNEIIVPVLPLWPQAGRVRVLDFGGGDGRLMQRFVERGADCFVVDYVHETVPGVTRLGDTLDDLPEHIEPFDFIISSHVIEHVAEPREIMGQLRSLLKPRGAHLVAVPHEIWRAAPLQPEPVTHVNFFTEQSLQALFVNTGYEVLHSSTRAVPTSGIMQTEIVVVGRPSANPGVAPNGYDRLKQLLNPDLMTYFWWFKRHPRRMLRQIKNRVLGK